MSNLSKYIKKSDIKCPICQTLLDVSVMSDKVFGCPKCRNMGNIDLWQALADTKKKLDIFQEFITKLYLNGNITDEQLHWLKKINQKD